MPLSEEQKDFIRESVDAFAAVAAVETPDCVFAEHGNHVVVGRDDDGRAKLWVGGDWFEAAFAIKLCECGHTHRPPPFGRRDRCGWPGCACARFYFDPQASNGIRERVLCALIAHEIGHLVQERDGKPTTGCDAEFDADREGATLVGVDEMTVAVIYADAWAERDEDHPPGPERVQRLRGGASATQS